MRTSSRSRHSSFDSRGVFACGSCGRQTRGASKVNTDAELCGQCWELAGIYNEYQDSGDHAATIETNRAAILVHCEEIMLKGGKLDADNQSLYDQAIKHAPPSVGPALGHLPAAKFDAACDKVFANPKPVADAPTFTTREMTKAVNKFAKRQWGEAAAKWKVVYIGSMISVVCDRDTTVKQAREVQMFFESDYAVVIDKTGYNAYPTNNIDGNTVITWSAK